MDWKPLALSVPLLFVLFQALSKTIPKDVSVFLINAYASLTGFFIMLALHFILSSDKSTAPQAKYIWIAVTIGALISIGNYGVLKAYSVGAPQALFTAVFYVALIIYGVLFGLLMWHEHLKAVQLFGIALAIIGIFIAAYFRK